MEISFDNTAIVMNDWKIEDKTYPTYLDNIASRHKDCKYWTRVTVNNGIENKAVTYLKKKYGLFYCESLQSYTQYLILKEM